MSNAGEARQVVLELFQDLGGFSLEDYRPFSDLAGGVGRIRDFLSEALAEQGWTLRKTEEDLFEVSDRSGAVVARFTNDRDRAVTTEGLGLLGLDHPLVAEQLAKWRSTSPEELGASVRSGGAEPSIVCWWLVEASTPNGERTSQLLALASTLTGARATALERFPERLLDRPAGEELLHPTERRRVFAEVAEPALHREIQHRGLLGGGRSFSADLIAWLEVGG